MSANPIYHLKDCYFFEVPKALWRQGYQTLDDVPEFCEWGIPTFLTCKRLTKRWMGKSSFHNHLLSWKASTR